MPVGFEQAICVHLLAPAGQEDRPVSDVLVWNAPLGRLEWVDRAGLARMGEQLDPVLGLASVGLVGLGGVITGVLQLLAAAAAPGIITKVFRSVASVMGFWLSTPKCIHSPVSCFCP